VPVSAFAARGICADLFELVLLEHDLLVGRHVLGPSARCSEILDFVAGEAAKVIEMGRPAEAMVEPDDARVLGEALEDEAELFVTGDSALLRLGAVEGFRIVSPRQFWEDLRNAPR
jgi:predicted nucleic acid-binding protein